MKYIVVNIIGIMSRIRIILIMRLMFVGDFGGFVGLIVVVKKMREIN